jgi:hypothetical protein
MTLFIVQQLINISSTNLEAGWYNYQWDAINLATENPELQEKIIEFKQKLSEESIRKNEKIK